MPESAVCVTGARPVSRADSRGARSVELAITYIERHFAERIALENLADLAHLSLCRFAAVFRRQVGMSPYRYVCSTRIRHAQNLLRQGLPASVVAGEVGFFDQSHFSRHFKNHCGMTPGEFAARARDGNCEEACTSLTSKAAKGNA
ncbi:helix-turn-helix transcriptional regulator [Pigmentiphaga aceris]|uniref:Helix-turn-helix transcriptional regulator n=1 Tax=Pigmentiphaga aceris TaxID=1940612 RepID=A0A5C0AZ46_9BURK|nr:AraC family transcriptional regulator [Pigmentiphaga aceris]QEI06683.1 helix-turn-helix transcriptional regulator [Pigmentiphaga aceris]